MPLEDPNVIDIITASPEGKTILVITDAGVTTDSEERNALFMEKLKTYMSAIMSGEMAGDPRTKSPKDYEIRVMCAAQPTDTMLSLRAITPKGDPENAISIEFEIFDGSGSELRKVEREKAEAPEISAKLASTIDFAMGLGLDTIKDGNEVAIAVVSGSEGCSVVVLAGFDDTREAARKHAATLGPEIETIAVCFEGIFSEGSSPVTAIIVEGSERGQESGVAFGQRCQPKGFLKKFKIIGERIFLDNCDSYFPAP